MKTELVNLYQKLGIFAPDGARGFLRCYTVETSAEVSGCREKPAVLILPGGGYGRTSAREMEPVALRFLARGYAAFVLEYSCAPFAFPVPLREAAMAVRFIRENAKHFGVGADMVAAVGFSAGGHLCGMLGTLYNSLEVADLGSPTLLRPDVLGLCYPVAVSWGRTHEGSFHNISGGSEEIAERLSLEKLVQSDMPPVFLWHTRDDASVPCRNSLILASALEEAGVDFVLHIHHKGVHGLSTADETVYPVYAMPKASAGVRNWPEDMMDFFADCGLQIRDRRMGEQV